MYHGRSARDEQCNRGNQGRKEGREEGRREGIIATVETAVKFGATREFAIEAAVQQFHVAREYVETIYNASKQKRV